jgi:hypothetical protein
MAVFAVFYLAGGVLCLGVVKQGKWVLRHSLEADLVLQHGKYLPAVAL